MPTCKHELVELNISFPRSITATVTFDGATNITAANSRAATDYYGVGPGHLKIHCTQCGREDYWTADRPDTWPKWARVRFMEVARLCPELLSLAHQWPTWHLLEGLP